jgi:hypothetical protein
MESYFYELLEFQVPSKKHNFKRSTIYNAREDERLILLMLFSNSTFFSYEIEG